VSRCQLLKTHFISLKNILVGIDHLNCRILDDDVRVDLINELVNWYVKNCGNLDTKDILRKGWKGFESMDDIELIEDWLETLQLETKSYTDKQFSIIDCATQIESALNLKLKLAKDIFKVG
jgi:hypothetical protein